MPVAGGDDMPAVAQRFRHLVRVLRRGDRIEPAGQQEHRFVARDRCREVRRHRATGPEIAYGEHARSEPLCANPSQGSRTLVGADPRDVLRARDRIMQRRVHLLGKIGGDDERCGHQRRVIAVARAVEHLRNQACELGKIGKRLQRADHEIECHRHFDGRAGLRVGDDGRPALRAQFLFERGERCGWIGMR